MPALQTSRGAAEARQGVGVSARGSVIDLFCGAGGLSHGFRLEGFDIVAGVDFDAKCKYPFERNNDAPFLLEDVAKIDAGRLNSLFTPGLPRVLVGCAPCQPFSKYSQGREDGRWQLLEHFSRLICEVQPDVVSMENVPRLQKFMGSAVFSTFVRALRNNDYFVDWKIAYCPDYGIPQSRSRLVLLASRFGPPGVPEATHTADRYRTVRDVIGDLPALTAGGADQADPLHRCSELSENNVKRMRASRPGGSWRDWKQDLVTPCHRRETGQGYSSVYGRMKWDEPAPTITTQFFGFGNGRFGHPEQDRAISLREGALIQTFPPDYAFVPEGQKIEIKTLGRLIGNAVPVSLGQAIARRISAHLEEYGR
ncbi:DNA (cytosine-5-)-methyltransferase [Sphingomonas sp. 7/4-4]|uniref:DNA cytosine methyltransferase n=1 Tax=Sphingomonas sp. 7/4-4 TaxID=3018446 RepID=UPI0022F3FFE9|nr:DNA (cytosine-5-)-methyltransferase [Sphingomonas sp. 7/4-4]WBY08127.1 DNA (cytosine-5-)-methyltransferase [Sphingomonas sp. 7/4-4]